ncbi:MAG: VIT domain-containing protein [Candidatus Micrarchaeota archaeon]|nr:VIT domain-containing protein [Candidatus Micrarchaeota archaeon]
MNFGKLTFFVLLAISLSLVSFADGMIMPIHQDDPYPLILNHHVNVKIENEFVTVHVDQEFQNDGYRDIEGQYIFPIHSGTVKNFQIVVDGKTYEGQLLSSDEAREIYNKYVLERKEASLLEYSGTEMFTANVVIPRGSRIRVQITYEQLVGVNAGTYYLFYPLSTERYTTKPIDPVNITVDITAPGKIGFVMSPTHDVKVERVSDSNAIVTYYSKEIPDRDFQLFYGVTEREYDVKLVGSRHESDDGYFMLFLYPTIEPGEEMPKDVVYVMDLSGSMDGEKIEQTKKSLEYGLGKLNPADRFNIVTFSSDAILYSQELTSASGQAVAKAQIFSRSLEASGSTNINDALVMAEGQFADDERVHVVVILTDGEDTTGHSTEGIIKAVRGAADVPLKVFPFGVGTDVDFELIDRISNEFGDGIPTYIRSDGELEASLSSFYDKIARPLLTEVKLEIAGGAGAYDVYPRSLPDIFSGSQLSIAGRYSGSGANTIILSGKLAGEEKKYEYEIEFPDKQTCPTNTKCELIAPNYFVERAWAVRKVGYLLDQIALEGESDELVAQVKTLAIKYGIPSPYTSYVSTTPEGDEVRRDVGIAEAIGGWGAIANSFTAGAAYKSAESAQDAATYAAETKFVEGKTFVQIGGVWKDTACIDGEAPREVAFGSPEYFSLASNPEMAKYLSIGERVWVCGDGQVLVTPSGHEGAPTNGTTTGPEPTPPSPTPPVFDYVPYLALLVLLFVAVVFSLGRRPGAEVSEVDMHRALSSDTRVQILGELTNGDRTPTDLSRKLGKSKATISEHLDKLVEAELVDKIERDGKKWVFYSLTRKGKSVTKVGG